METSQNRLTEFSSNSTAWGTGYSHAWLRLRYSATTNSTTYCLRTNKGTGCSTTLNLWTTVTINFHLSTAKRQVHDICTSKKIEKGTVYFRASDANSLLYQMHFIGCLNSSSEILRFFHQIEYSKSEMADDKMNTEIEPQRPATCTHFF